MSIKSITVVYSDDTTEVIIPAVPTITPIPEVVEFTVDVTSGETPTVTVSNIENKPQ